MAKTPLPIVGKQIKLSKLAFITGVAGQDGSYLAEYLLKQNYRVFGIIRPTMRRALGNIGDDLLSNPKFELYECDVNDWYTLQQLFAMYEPDECYHLAAQSNVGASWNTVLKTMETNVQGTLNILEAVRAFSPKTKVYMACSSEMFGNYDGVADENTPLNPRSPYGTSKVATRNLAVNYRESYGVWVACGIAFNHESPRRGIQFVTQKIIRGAKREKQVQLGTLDVSRDWGYAPEYVEAMHKMLQREKPEDFVLATGETHTLKEFVDEVRKYCPELKVTIDKKYSRPAELNVLKANPKKAKEVLGWEAKVKMPELVKIMWEA